MAVRNPTTFVTYQDERTIWPREIVKTTTPSSVLDDQTYCLDATQVFVCDVFEELSTNAGAYAALTNIRCIQKAMCGTVPTTVTNAKWSAYSWADIGVTQYSLRLGTGTTSVITVNAAITTPTWRGPSASTAWDTDSAFTLLLEAQVDAGAGNVYVGGLFCWSEET